MAEHLPEVLFLMAGSHCQEFVGRSLPANVVLMGVVPDAVKIVLLRVADVALNPVVRGSGTNLKIVEYMAAGAPVVSTEFGARGIDMVAGEHLTIAAITDFVDAIGQVLTDPAAAYAAAVRARSLVEQQYDWQVVGARLLGRLASELDRLQASAQTLGATA